MNRKIDLRYMNTRTDIALEILSNIYKGNYITYGNIIVNSMNVNKSIAKKYDILKGSYVTISFKDATDIENKKNLTDIFSKELIKFMSRLNIKDTASILVVGIGNSNIAADSLGPKVIDKIIVTKYLEELNIKSNYRLVSTFAPRVIGQSGIKSTDAIKAIVESIKPNALIIVDALACSDIKSINKMIQITNTGLIPGDSRDSINSDILKIPIISIGIPTSLSLSEVNPKLQEYIITPKEIDLQIIKLSEVLANGINYALQHHVKDFKIQY